jgi:transposase InsO family protein
MGFIAEYAPTCPVTRLTRLLGVAPSSYYAWKRRQARPTPTPRAARRAEITRSITMLHAAHHGYPGRRPMQQLLRTVYGQHCSLGLVHAIMTEQGLAARRHRRRAHRARTARPANIPNLCRFPDGRPDFTSDRPGAKTVGDLTYIRTTRGWVYLFTVLDLATRAVIGWALAATATTDQAIAALAMAHTHGVLAEAAIFHSDHGPQYTATAFAAWCAAAGVRQSMGETGVCWDNAVAESFYATLKGDLGGIRFVDLADARRQIVPYIEGWYNRQRPHSWNQGDPPLMAWNRPDWPAPTLHQT